MYSPGVADEYVIQSIFETLKSTTYDIKKRDMVVLMGDFNANVVSCQHVEESV